MSSNESHTLHFEVNEEVSLAFTEQFLKGSATHQKTRRRTQLFLPVCLFLILIVSTLSRSFEPTQLVLYAIASVAWFLYYPKRFDANVRKQAMKMTKESSHQKSYGKYQLTLSEDGLNDVSPTGESHFKWTAVDRVELTDTYLFIFLTGNIGYPIALSYLTVNQASDIKLYVESHLG